MLNSPQCHALRRESLRGGQFPRCSRRTPHSQSGQRGCAKKARSRERAVWMGGEETTVPKSYGCACRERSPCPHHRRSKHEAPGGREGPRVRDHEAHAATPRRAEDQGLRGPCVGGCDCRRGHAVDASQSEYAKSSGGRQCSARQARWVQTECGEDDVGRAFWLLGIGQE